MSITSITGRCKQGPHKKDGNQLEDAEGDELEKPVQAKIVLLNLGRCTVGSAKSIGMVG